MQSEKLPFSERLSRGGGTGRHACLKHMWTQVLEGSSPSLGTGRAFFRIDLYKSGVRLVALARFLCYDLNEISSF